MKRAVLLSLLLLGVPRAALAADPPTAAAAPKPADAPVSAADAALGKQHFLQGLELFKQQIFDAALAEFEQSYALGRRPTALRNVAQCHRELKQFAEAYDALSRLLTVHASQLKDSEKADIQAALTELAGVTATLSLSVNEAGAQIAVDGKDVATSPLEHKLRLNVGNHKVRATKQGFEPAELDFTLFVKQDASEQLVLKKMAAAPAAPASAQVVGHLRVKATPYSADIIIDGERVASGKFEGDVSEGDHALDVSAQGFVSAHRTFKVSGGQSASESVALDPFVPEKPVVHSPFARLYGGLDLTLLRHLNGYQPLLTACGDTYVQCNQPTYPAGGGVLHVGYSFDWLSVEFVGAFSVEVRSESMTAEGPKAVSGGLLTASSNAQRNEQMSADGFAGFLGLGLRATSSDTFVRVTAGASPGLSLRHYAVSRTLSNGVDATYADEGTAAAVGVLTDVALLLGSSPGPRFRIGLFLWMDFPEGDILSDGGTPLPATSSGALVERPQFVLQHGAQFLIGPTLGVQFGR